MNAQSKPESSIKAAMSVTECCRLLQMSRSQFYLLAKRGVFHTPLQLESTKRPYLTASMVEDNLKARETGIGVDGKVVLFNERHEKPVGSNQKPGVKVDLSSITSGLKQLGLDATKDQIQQALENEFPRGAEGIEEGILITKVFRYLKRSGSR